MAFNLINPFFAGDYVPPNTYNQYSMWLSGITTQPQQNFFISARTNSIDTAMRSANPQFTVSIWIKPMGTQILDTTSNGGSGMGTVSAGTVGRAFFSKWQASAGLDRNQYMYMSSSNKICWMGYYNSSNSCVLRQSTTQLTTGTTWYHLAFCYDSSQTTSATIARVYLNGSEITSWDVDTVSTTNKYFTNQTTESSRGYVRIGATQWIGTPATNPSDSFIGKIDECTFYTTALTASEVMQIYTGTTSGTFTGMSAYSTYCIAHYRMGDASGDLFSNNNWQLQNVYGATPNMNGSGGTSSSKVLDAP